MPQDHAQHVVEVVRDAARQAADRLHPLRLLELVLQPAPLPLGLRTIGDVLDEAHEPTPRRVVLGHRVDVADLARRMAPDLELRVVVGAVREAGGEGRVERSAVLG